MKAKGQREWRKKKGKLEAKLWQKWKKSQTPKPEIKSRTPANVADTLPLSHRDKRHHQPVCLKVLSVPPPLHNIGIIHYRLGHLWFFRFCQSFTSNFLSPFPSPSLHFPSDLSLKTHFFAFTTQTLKSYKSKLVIRTHPALMVAVAELWQISQLLAE